MLVMFSCFRYEAGIKEFITFYVFDIKGIYFFFFWTKNKILNGAHGYVLLISLCLVLNKSWLRVDVQLILP